MRVLNWTWTRSIRGRYCSMADRSRKAAVRAAAARPASHYQQPYRAAMMHGGKIRGEPAGPVGVDRAQHSICWWPLAPRWPRGKRFRLSHGALALGYIRYWQAGQVGHMLAPLLISLSLFAALSRHRYDE
jgi:hypothetical protein